MRKQILEALKNGPLFDAGMPIFEEEKTNQPTNQPTTNSNKMKYSMYS